MINIKVPEIFDTFGKTITERSPEILTGFGIAGMLLTTVLAVKATPRALRLIDEKKKETGKKELTKIEVVKTTWKCYIPAAISGTASVACVIGSSKINHKRNMALATAYSLSETARREYQEKVVETIGEKKEQAIRDEIAKDRIEKNPVTNKEVIITGAGDLLCYDSISGRYFKSNIDKIRTAESCLNRELINSMYVSLNEFYYELDIPPIKVGEDIGWNVDDGQIHITFSSQLAENNTPCLVIDYNVAPRYDYTKLM